MNSTSTGVPSGRLAAPYTRRARFLSEPCNLRSAEFACEADSIVGCISGIPPISPYSCNFRTAVKTVKLRGRLPDIVSYCRRVESADGREIESRRIRLRRAGELQSAAVTCLGHFGSRLGVHTSAQSLTITNPWCQRVNFSQQILICLTSWEPSGSRGKELKSLPSTSKNTAPGLSSAVRAQMAAGVHQKRVMPLPFRLRPALTMRSAFTRFSTLCAKSKREPGHVSIVPPVMANLNTDSSLEREIL